MRVSNTVLVSLLVSWFGVSGAQAKDRNMAATVVSVQGTALIRDDGDGKKGSAARNVKVGDKVYEGDVINTPSNGLVKLLMQDKTIMDIGKSALFKVQEYKNNGGLDRNVDVSMMYGSIRASVTQPIKGKGSFKVRTASATMGVRGTEFVVKSEIADMKQAASAIKSPGAPPPASAGSGGGAAPAAKTEVTVVQGRVDVEPPKPKDSARVPAAAKQAVVSLTAGKQLTTSTGDAAPAKPVALSASQMSEVKSTAKIEDNTFKKAIVLDMSGGSSGGSNSGSGGGSSGSGGASAGGGVGNLTASIIADTIAAPSAAVSIPASAATAGFAGTISATNILNGPPAVNLIAGGLRRVKIILVR